MSGNGDALARDCELCECGHLRADHACAAPHACEVCDDHEICDGFNARGAED